MLPFPGGCCSYSPEYYINIRTGIHYFPKGNNTTGTDASNRFKSGLNRIEEKNDEVSNEEWVKIMYRGNVFMAYRVRAVGNLIS